MANQIASNIPSHGAPEIEVAHHLIQFWTPTMLRYLSEDADPLSLSPIVIKAIKSLELELL
jgi:hypothetical protein